MENIIPKLFLRRIQLILQYLINYLLITLITFFEVQWLILDFLFKQRSILLNNSVELLK